MKPTPGPYRNGGMHDTTFEFLVLSQTGRVLAKVEPSTTFREDVEEAEANANLFAAAPKLLKAVEELLLYIETPSNELKVAMYPQSIDYARTTLANAKGTPS